jgi:hypothetical protein
MHVGALVCLGVLWLCAGSASAAGAENAMLNPGFEEGMDAWFSIGGELSSSDEQAKEGSRSCLISSRTASYEGPNQSLNRRLLDGHRYTMTAWVRLRRPGATSRAQMTVEQTDGAGTDYHALASEDVSADGWVELKGTFDFRSTGILSALRFYVEVQDATADFFVDDVSAVDDGLADGLHVEVSQGEGGATRLRAVMVPARGGTARPVKIDVLGLDGSAVLSTSAAPGAWADADLPEGLYRARAGLALADGTTAEASRLVAVGDVAGVLGDIAANAHEAAAGPALAAYAGWLEYLAFQLEETTAALGEARAEGAAHPLDEKEALVTAAGLFDWLARVRQAPATLAERRGMFEWAYRSAVDGTGQPFVITVPQSYDGREAWPLMVLLHGHGLYHTRKWPYPEAQDCIELRPLGRSTGGGYSELSEYDVLEAIEYVRAHWKIDPERIHLHGDSMGGFGTFSLAARFPDLFASARPACGAAIGQALANAMNLPFRIIHGTEDWTVPIVFSRAAAREIRRTGGTAILDEADGWGHIVVDDAELLAETRKWAFRQARPARVERVHYEATDELASGAYWVKVLEWGPRAEPAAIDAQLRPDNTLYLSLDNVAIAEVDLSASPADRDAALTVAVQSRATATIEPPLPDRLFVVAAGDGWEVSPVMPALPEYRLHFPSGAQALYHGEPLMVVWGTQADAETNRRIYEVAQLARKSPNARWPDPGYRKSGKPTDMFISGQLPGKPDAEVTPEDMATCNLMLIGTAEQNSLARRLAGRLPVTIADGKLACDDGPAWSLAGRGFGLLHYNPEAPRRLVFWVGSGSPEFYAHGNALMNAQGEAQPPDLLILDAGDGRLVAARRYDSRWRWESGYVESPLLSPRAASQGAFTAAICDAYRRATGADFALAAAPWASRKPAFAARETRVMDVVAGEFTTRLAGMRLSGEELLALSEVCAKMEGAALSRWREENRAARARGETGPEVPGTPRLLPQIDPATIRPDREYRVVLYPWAIWSIVGEGHFVPSDFEALDLTVREALARELAAAAAR